MDIQENKQNTPLLRFKNRPYPFGQIQTTVLPIGTVLLNSTGIKLITPFEAVRMAKKLIIDPNKEHFIVIYLTPVRKNPKCELVSLGTLTASIVHPREVFRSAIKYNSTEIIILHNHPSGDVCPSKADIELTKRLKNAGQLLGIEVLDHIIFTTNKKFYTFNNE
jgi:DNA repair protein RadC